MTEEQLTRLFGDVTVVQAVLWLIAACVLAGFAVKIKAWQRLKQFIATIDALAELPQKIRLLDDIHHELHPNHGSSVRDAVDRTERAQKELAAELRHYIAEHRVWSDDKADRIKELEDTLNVRKDTT